MTERSRKSFSLPVLHIMLALAEGAKHGYAIKQQVEARTAGAICLGPGTLYEAIQRLEDAVLIEEAPARGGAPANGQQAQRRYYRLTDRGRKTLKDELHQLGQLVDAARANARLNKGLV